MKDQSLSKARKLKIMYHHIETAEPLISKYIFYSLQYVTDGLDNPTLWIFQCTLVESLQRIPGNNTVSVYYSQKVFFTNALLHCVTMCLTHRKEHNFQPKGPLLDLTTVDTTPSGLDGGAHSSDDKFLVEGFQTELVLSLATCRN